MAIYTTFFLCNPQQLAAGFPRWRSPLPTAVKRVVKNPFTGQAMTIETREPEWPEGAFAEPQNYERQVVAIKGEYRDYQDYLEGRLPAFVRGQPHWAAKGLMEIEVGALAEALDCESSLECALYPPPSSSKALQKIPAAATRALALLDADGLNAIATKWAATMSGPDYTQSTTGEVLSDGWSQGDAMEALRPIAALARKAAADQQMYLLTEA